MYAVGQRVLQDDAEAVKWYRLAADQGNAPAQSDLGFMYANGRGVPQDGTEAVKWYRLAANQGNALAQYNLGFMYANGRGVPQDYLLAHMWFDLAAARGNEQAIKSRDTIAARMTPAQLAEAQKQVRGWKPMVLPNQTSEAPPPPESVRSILPTGLGLKLYNDGRYAEAEPFLESDLEYYKTTLGSNHPQVATALGNVGENLSMLGRYNEAESFLMSALLIHEDSFGQNVPVVAVDLNNLGRLYQAQGRFDEAESALGRALQLRENLFGPNHAMVGQSLNNLATLYHAKMRYADAELMLGKSLDVFEKASGSESFDVANVLNNLAALYYDQNRYDDAEPYYERSLMIWEKLFGPDNPFVANSLQNIATSKMALKRYSEAELLFKRALDINERSLGYESGPAILNQNSLLVTYGMMDNVPAGLPILRALINKGGAGNTALPFLMTALNNRSVNAAAVFSDSFSILQNSIVTAAGEATKKLAMRYAAGSDELAQLVRQDQDIEVETQALGKALFDAVSKPNVQRVALNEDRMRARTTELQSEQAKLKNVMLERFPKYVNLAKAPALPLGEIQQLLVDDEALIAFAFGDNTYAGPSSFTWVITRTTADWRQLTITAKQLDEQVGKLRESILSPSDIAFDAGLAFQIYNETLAPIADKLTGKKRLSVFVNGALTSIPLQLLVTKDPKGKDYRNVDWLVKSFAITNLPSIYSLKTMRSLARPSQAKKPLIAFADPIFRPSAPLKPVAVLASIRGITSNYSGVNLDADTLFNQLPPLPGTKDEVQGVSRFVKAADADLFIGAKATETAVKDAKLEQYKIVYFATHALVSGDLQKFSKAKAEPALILSRPSWPTERDDGILEASEVAQLKLDADWVVLSACNTAAPEGPGAEALSGLARAFIYAGARSLLVSNWEINDASTSDLMKALFAQSSQKSSLSHGEALQRAELEFLRKARKHENANPKYWAPFIVIGEPSKGLGEKL